MKIKGANKKEESRNCRSCKQDFIIEPDDFGFYEKIQVPPPTWCPDCRQQRRYAWRNERVLYRRKCDLCSKSTVTIYSPNKPYKVYCPPCWWSDNWDPMEYGRDFDESKPFLEQWHELQLVAPRIALLTKNSVNSEYTNHSSDNKDAYLCFGTFDSENAMYCTNVWGGKTKDCMDCYRILGGNELLYGCIDSERCYRCQYGIRLRDCTDCFYCFDCRGSSNCFLSSNLRNKQYHILNKPHKKEEYLKKIEEFNLDSSKARKELYDKWLDLMEKESLHRFAVIEKSTEVTGNNILNSKRAYHAFDGNDLEDVKYSALSVEMKDSMDFYHVGFGCELIYEGHGMIYNYHALFNHLSYHNRDITYCDGCQDSENLFGCVSVKNKKYCILNKQYSEEEYKKLKDKIIRHMNEMPYVDKVGNEFRYGEFFPGTLSPIGYNETQGMVYMPLSKDEALKKGYRWENEEFGTFGKETVEPENIPDNIGDVEEGFLKEVFRCEDCSINYNVIGRELSFYKKENIPFPRLCPNCRYKCRIALRLPRKLWHRQCMCDYKVHKNTTEHSHHPTGRCLNEFETSYSPERKEVVYCEECYNAEVV